MFPAWFSHGFHRRFRCHFFVSCLLYNHTESSGIVRIIVAARDRTTVSGVCGAAARHHGRGLRADVQQAAASYAASRSIREALEQPSLDQLTDRQQFV